MLALAAEPSKYTGTWASSNSDSNGKITMSLGTSPDDSTVTFTISTYEVKTKVKSLKVDGDTVMVAYEFDLQDTRLLSTVTAKRNGDKLDGRYVTTVVGGSDQVDSGTFQASK